MADNLDITAGTGTTIATDESAASVHYQIVKLADGTADATAVIAADIGVKANAIRVVPANNITDGTYIGDIKFGEALPAGTNAIGKLAANSGVDIGDVDVTSIAAGTNVIGKVRLVTATGDEVTEDTDDSIQVTIVADDVGIGGGTQYTEDVATANPIVGTAIVMERDDALSTLTPIEGDWAAMRCSAEGALWVQEFNSDAMITALQIMDDWDNAASDGASVSGDVAHDTADAGEPVKVGGKAYSFDGTVPGTAVAEADRANFITDLYGRQYVETCHPRFFNARADYGAAQTNATVQAAPGAGLKLYITDIMISNGATAGNITLLDGSGGTVIWEIYTAINGGCVANFKTPIVLTANTLLAITSTTVTTHSLAIQGYIAP